MTKKLYFYIVKKFLFSLFLVVLSISLLIAMINIFELLDMVSDKKVSFWQVIAMDLLQIPSFIDNIAVFLVMLASMITLFSLSIRSEITVMRASGLSFFQIVSPIAGCAFFVGVFFVLIFNPASIASTKTFNRMEQVLIQEEKRNLLEPVGGIWLKQQDVTQDNGEIIIRADKIYRNDLKMKNVSLWFFDSNGHFYKKINASYMILKEENWYLKNAIINDKTHVNASVADFSIPTNLKAEFITKKILNNFSDVRLFSVYDLPALIEGLKDSGFPPRKFVVHYYSILTIPFLFVGASLIAAFFAVNNVRSKNNIFLLISGIICGLVLHIGFIIIRAIGASGLIPIFLSTWMATIILLAISMLLIFRKEGSY